LATPPPPVRAITPPRDDASSARVEIENEPAKRAADVVSGFEKVEDALPAEGYARTRRDIFDSTSTPKQSFAASAGPRALKEITPPRDDIVKRVLKEQTPERNADVVRESDRSAEAMPSSGQIAETRAKFASTRQKSIERSGVTIEGELAAAGIAKSRLALFSDPTAVAAATTSSSSSSPAADIESGIAKERMNLFKTLEQQQQQQRTSPTHGTVKQLKEFTPPPAGSGVTSKDEEREQTPVAPSSDFVPEAGLAKSRMKQYLDSAGSNAEKHSAADGQDAEMKGGAKSLLAKWKSMENVVKEGVKETSPSNETKARKHARAFSKDRQTTGDGSSSSSATSEDCLPQTGTARSLLNKWQNIEHKEGTLSKERRGPRPITPPPPGSTPASAPLDEHDAKPTHVHDDELATMIGKGHARSALAK
jgi:hypothetical protein